VERGLDVRIRVVFDHRSTVHGLRTAPIHDGRRVAGAFPYGGGRDISRGDEPDVRKLSPQPLHWYEVVHLERVRLGMPYSQQVDHVEALLERSLLNRLQPSVLEDCTGVGRPVFDSSRAVHVRVGGGQRAFRSLGCCTRRGDYRRGRGIGQPGGVVGAKRGTGVEAASPTALGRPSHRRQPVRCRCTGPELQYFRVRSTEAGNATFNAREGVHGDLVLALALAVFGLSRPQSVDAARVAWAR